ncbi:MAG: hypothetical protein ABI614_08300, partial [Planctomycetota bacterium]
MIRYATSRRWLFTVGALVISLTNAAHSQDQVDRPVSPSAKQNNPPGSAREPVKTYAGAITEGDRIIRLDTSIDTYKKQLGELETELERTKSEEGAANKAVEQVAKQIENMEAERQKADDAGDQFEAEKLRIRLAEVEGKLLLAKEQFDLAIRNRKTIQEQIVTFQQKITNDQAALDKLKGVSPP